MDTETKKILDDHETRIKKIEDFIKSLESKPPTEDINLSGIKKLSKKTGVNEKMLKEIFDIEDDQLTVVKITGEKERDKTQNIALLVLLGYKYLLSKEEVLSQEIRRNVAENNIPLNNFATHLSNVTPSLIRRKGKLRSPKTTYKLTTLGESKARELVKVIASE
ncbi:MAG: hypothetical protein J7J92_02520 [Candidatus Aenigmarchaeota archaeon]|nr:hypothetical protein [Candidatus Aenigmarchaeota archaeon]